MNDIGNVAALETYIRQFDHILNQLCNFQPTSKYLPIPHGTRWLLQDLFDIGFTINLLFDEEFLKTKLDLKYIDILKQLTKLHNKALKLSKVNLKFDLEKLEFLKHLNTLRKVNDGNK